MASAPKPEFEVLPPDRAGGAGSWPRLIAHLMDNLLKVPGTKARIGLNPFLEVLPLFGDGAAMLITATLIVTGAKRGAPKIVLARMAANTLLNGLVGTIPVVGEVFAFWFKPSARNYHLLIQHTGPDALPRRKSTWKDAAFVFGLLALVLVLIGVFVAIGFYVVSYAYHALMSL